MSHPTFAAVGITLLAIVITTSSSVSAQTQTPVPDQAVLIDFQSYESENGDHSSVKEYTVYVAQGGQENIVTFDEYSCCKDEQGQCQDWSNAASLTCHGIDVDVDYSVAVVVGRETNIETGEKTHEVYYPTHTETGIIIGQEEGDVTMTEEEWEAFQENALGTLVDERSNELAEEEADEQESGYESYEQDDVSMPHDSETKGGAFKHPVRLGLLILGISVAVSLLFVVVRRVRGRSQRRIHDEGHLNGQYASINN